MHGQGVAGCGEPGINHPHGRQPPAWAATTRMGGNRPAAGGRATAQLNAHNTARDGGFADRLCAPHVAFRSQRVPKNTFRPYLACRPVSPDSFTGTGLNLLTRNPLTQCRHQQQADDMLHRSSSLRMHRYPRLRLQLGSG